MAKPKFNQNPVAKPKQNRNPVAKPKFNKNPVAKPKKNQNHLAKPKKNQNPVAKPKFIKMSVAKPKQHQNLLSEPKLSETLLLSLSKTKTLYLWQAQNSHLMVRTPSMSQKIQMAAKAKSSNLEGEFAMPAGEKDSGIEALIQRGQRPEDLLREWRLTNHRARSARVQETRHDKNSYQVLQAIRN